MFQNVLVSAGAICSASSQIATSFGAQYFLALLLFDVAADGGQEDDDVQVDPWILYRIPPSVDKERWISWVSLGQQGLWNQT